MSQTKLIYDAWKNTPKPIIYNTSDGKKEIKKPVELLPPEEIKDYNSDLTGICSVCGEEIHGGAPVKKVFGASYVDWGYHKFPEEKNVCENCLFCFTMNAKAGRCCLFRYSFVAEKKIHFCNRKEMREWILNPPEPPFLMVCAVSQKKHLAVKSRISYDREVFYCNIEEIAVKINRKEFTQKLEIVEALRSVGITITEIQTGELSPNKYKSLGFEGCQKAIELLERLKGYEALEIALFVSVKKEMEDLECIMDL